MSPHLSHPYGGGLSDGRVLPPMPNVPASMPSMGEHQFMNPHSTHKKAYSLPYRPHPQPGAAAQPPGMGRLYGGSPVSLIGSDKSSFSSSRLRSNEDGYSIGGNDNIHLPTIVGPSPKQGNGPHIQSMNTKDLLALYSQWSQLDNRAKRSKTEEGHAEEVRKERHNMAEKRRRSDMNVAIDRLKGLLPQQVINDRRLTKVEVLCEVADHLMELQHLCTRLITENTRLKAMLPGVKIEDVDTDPKRDERKEEEDLFVNDRHPDHTSNDSSTGEKLLKRARRGSADSGESSDCNGKESPTSNDSSSSSSSSSSSNSSGSSSDGERDEVQMEICGDEDVLERRSTIDAKEASDKEEQNGARHPLASV